jgi:protein for assembly of pre-ribosomal particles containing 18S rRNA
MTATANILNDYDKYLNSLMQARQSLVDRHHQIDEEIAALKKEQAQIDEHLGKVSFQESFDLSSLSVDKKVYRSEKKISESGSVDTSKDSEAHEPVEETPEITEEETISESDDVDSVSDDTDDEESGVQQEFDLSAAIKESEKPVEKPESDIDDDLGLGEVESDDWSDLSQDEGGKDDASDSDSNEPTDVDTKKIDVKNTSDDKKSDEEEKPKKTSARRRRSTSSQSRPSSRRKSKKDDWQSDPEFDTSEDIEHIDFGF